MTIVEKEQAVKRTILVGAVALVIVTVTPLMVTAGLVYLLFLR